MTEQSPVQILKPPASGRKLQTAIEHARKDLDTVAKRRLWATEREWHRGALFWRVLLDLSLEAAANGLAPTFRKNDLAYELKRRAGSTIEVDAKLWRSFLSFHVKHLRGRLQAAAAKSGLPVLCAERATNDGLGGDPGTTEACYWLCFGAESKPSGQTIPKAPARTRRPAASAAVDVVSSIEQRDDGLERPDLKQSGRNQTEATEAQEASVPKSAEVRVDAQDASGSCRHSSPNPVFGDASLLWLAKDRLHAGSSSHIPVAMALALAVLMPILTGAAADVFLPLQTLADSIRALLAAFDGSITVR